MPLTPKQVFRQYNVDGVPASGDYEPEKPEIIALLDQIQATNGQSVTRNTYASLAATIPPSENYMGIVLNDPDPTKNGYYSRVSAVWVYGSGFPNTIARLTVTGGTANAVQAAATATVNPANVLAFFIDVSTPNTLPVTISINGAAAIPVKNINNDDYAAGEWSGRIFLSNETTYLRALVDAAAAASAAASAALAQDWAEAAGLVAVPDGSIEEVKLSADLQADLDAAREYTPNAIPPGGRLTLTADTPFPASDVSGATTVYYEAATGNAVPVFGGTVWAAMDIGAGLTLPLDADTGHTGYHAVANIYDVFAFDNSGTLDIGTGPSWSAGGGSVTNGASLRGTGAGSTELESYQGVLVNKNSITLRFGSGSGDTVVVAARCATYLGSIEPTADGQASDSAASRCLYNAFNQTLRMISLQIGGGATYDYSTAAWRQVEGVGTFLAKILFGLAGGVVDVEFSALVVNSTTTARFVTVGIDFTGTTPEPLSKIGGASCTSTSYGQPVARYVGSPGIGRHSIIPLERGAGTDTQTWLEPVTGSIQVGLLGSILL